MKICEHCGAPVYGDVCEYCDMPAKKPAPPKAEYKSEKPNKTLKLPVRKHSVKKKKNKKFLRKALLCIFALGAISGIGSALSNRNSNTVYIQQPAERAIEYNDNHYGNYNYYDDDYDDYYEDYFEDDDYDDDYDDYFDDDDYDDHHDDEHHVKRPVYSANEAFQKTGVFPEGTYQIGVDIPEGLYIFIPDMADGHGVQGVYSDPECENQISSAYVHFDGTRIAEISGNGYLEFSWATAYNLDMHPEIVNDPHTTDGMFIVGRDIPAGTYHLEEMGELSDYAEWYIYSSINAVGAVLKEAGVLYEGDGYVENVTNEITLNDGEYLELRHCIITD